MRADNIAYQRDDALISGLEYVPYFELEVDPHDRKAVSEYCYMLDEKRLDAQDSPIYGGWSFIANIAPFSSDAPPPDGARPLPHFARTSARQLACSEDLVYRTFTRQQGIQIPWYFGKFLVKVPNGEEAYILFMEYIKGCTVPQWLTHYAEAKPSEKIELLENLKDIILSILDVYDVLGQEGMYHQLCTLNDIIIKSDNRVVVVDFAETPMYETLAQVQAQVTAWSLAVAQSQGEDIVNSILRFSWNHCQLGECTSEFLAWVSDPAIVERVPNWQKAQRDNYLPLAS